MVILSPSTLLDSPEIYKIESNLISLFERTFKKGINSDIHKLKSSVKRGFSSATFKIQIDKIIDDIYIYTIDFTDKLLKTTLKADFHTIHISHFLSASDANIRDGYLELTEEAVTECTSLASEITESIIRVLKDEAIYQESNDKLAARVLNLWGGEKYRAERWARTFSADVATNTTLYRYQTSGIEEYQFYATIDNRTSPQCRMLHGTVFKTNSSEAQQYRCPLHPNCFIEGTRLELAGDLVSALRCWYDGEVVELTLSDGSRLAVTPNHMLLTPYGFLSAKLARSGDNIISSSGFERGGLSINPHDDNIHPTVEKVFSTLSVSGSMLTISVPPSPVYLHNDGEFIKSDIDIIYPKCFLKGRRNTANTEHLLENLFRSTNKSFPTFSSSRYLFPVLFSLAFSADGCMSGSRKTNPIFESRVCHPNVHCSTPISNSNSILAQHYSDHSRIAIKILSEGFDAHSGIVESGQFRNIDFFSSVSSSLDLPTYRDSHFFESVDNRVGFDIEPLSELCRRHSRLIKLCKIVKVDIIPYHGYVYDFQTLSTLCIGNGVITSNCRSTILPVSITTKIPDSLRYENRDFDKPVSQNFKPLEDKIDRDIVKKTFKNIDDFRDKYSIPQYILNKDVEQRLLKLGLSINGD